MCVFISFPGDSVAHLSLRSAVLVGWHWWSHVKERNQRVKIERGQIRVAKE